MGDLIKHLNGGKDTILPSVLVSFMLMPLFTFLKTKRDLMLDIQQVCRKRIVICKHYSKRPSHILFDGRHIELYGKCNLQIWYIWLNPAGVFKKSLKGTLSGCRLYKIKNSTNTRCLPTQIHFSKLVVSKSLLELLKPTIVQISPSLLQQPQIPLPSCREETLYWLKMYGLLPYVTIYWSYYLYPKTGKPKTVDWISTSSRNIDCNIQPVVLEAFSGPGLCFRMAYSKPTSCRKPKQNIVKNTNVLHDVKTNNRSCSFSLSLVGISQAYRLGLLETKEDLVTLSSQLTNNTPRAWFHLDSKGNIRHAAFDVNQKLSYFEIYPPQCDNFASWKLFFDHVWTECEQTAKTKQTLLNPILQKYNEFVYMDTHSKCFKSLLNYINKTTIILYTRGDSVLHGLKLAFAHYTCTEKKEKCVKIKQGTKNTITGLSGGGVTFENIYYLMHQEKDAHHPYQDEGESLSSLTSNWTGQEFCQLLPKPLIDDQRGKSIVNTKIYAPCRIIPAKSTLDVFLKKRSSQLLSLLQITFSSFGKYLVDKYSLDINTLETMSLASISIKCIMISFFEKGGPQCQSIEKTKIHYAQQIRKNTRGGFSYSFNDAINYGDSHHFKSGTAVGIQEYDINSCYGYSACNMKVPGSFCVGYVSHPRVYNFLERTDKFSRVNSFEYQSCMYILHRINQDDTIKVRSVYSNFSPLGIFYINKYPIDLVIIFDNCFTLLFQFDGQFTHGCKTCPRLNRYANDEQEETLIKRTLARDRAITKWTVNKNCRYLIYTDCCCNEFNKLKSDAFTSQLAHLINPYKSLPSDYITANEILNSHPNLTYILLASGSIPNCQGGGGLIRKGPLITWKKTNNGNWIQDFDKIVETPIIFTRDTFEFAVGKCGFQVNKIEWCYFYKRCNILPLVYQSLIDERMSSSSKAISGFIKSVINYSVG